MNIDKLLSTSFKWDNIETILDELSHKNKVRFALFCTKQVKHLIDSKEAIQAIDIVELFLEDKATAEECKKASNAVYAAAATTTAAYTAVVAASSASSAAYAAYTAYTAAYTAYTAAYAAYTAYTAACTAYTAYTAASATSAYTTITNTDQLKQEQMDYLRELIMGELSEEERDSWLLITSI